MALEPEMAKFRAIRTEEDLKRLHAENPGAAARFIEVGNRVHQLMQQGMLLANQRQAEAQQVHQQAYAARAQQYQQAVAQEKQRLDSWARANDAIVERDVAPELADRDKRGPFQEKVKRFLTQDIGLSDQDLHNYQWAFRSAQGAKLVVKAMKYDEMVRRARNATPVAAPVLKPGNLNGGSGQRDTPHAAAARGDMAAFDRLMRKREHARNR
jgi:hypothetical protein